MKYVEIPHTQLNPTTLRTLIEEFITREGTEYEKQEVPLDDKIEAVIQQLNAGDAVITWNTETETSNIVMKRDLPPVTEE